ncbi:WhiB family transcriptional regulator [Mycolicibacterium fortuitum]|uniref:WhiB family transcriptional regulator n=1 Tax=Mycolicibacterium fortuitum TaxID=1766 RepID=UPI00096FC7C5|nr:WhiB family transcriptional regulator [Mycolicibacterium fortuitum]
MPECLPTDTGTPAEAWKQRSLCRLYDPELWHSPHLLEQGREICGQCPAIKECAQNALRLAAAPPYRLSGMWAGVDIPETVGIPEIPKSVYRNRLRRLRHVAATGAQLPTRARRPRIAV